MATTKRKTGGKGAGSAPQDPGEMPSVPRPPDPAARQVLVTGFPVFAARQLVRELVSGGDQIWLLARGKFMEAAQGFATALGDEFAEMPPVQLLQGDILDVDLGLSGAQIRTLHAEIQEIHHIAAVQYLGTPKRKMRLVNVEGQREVLEVALGMRSLQRLCLWSTAFVAGDRVGVVREDELNLAGTFRNEYEHSKAEAEALGRAAMSKLPITILRPTIVVGDTQTGIVDRFDGIYLGIRRIVTAATNVAVPMPASGSYPLNVVPADYVAKAARVLARHPNTVGGTYHLADPQPLTAKRFFDAVADAAGRPRPSVFLPHGVVRAVLNLPGIRAIARDDRRFVEWFDADIRFDTSHADAALAGSGIACPAVQSYVDVLVRYVRDHA